MPLPTANDLHPVNQLDTEFAIALGPDLAKDFVADRAAPARMTTRDRGDYFVWNKGDFYRREMEKRADSAESKVAGYRVTTASYKTETYALKTLMEDRVRARALAQSAADESQIYYLMAQAKLNRDAVFRDKIFATGLWTSNTEQTGVAGVPAANQFKHFSDSASTPLLVLQTQMKTVHTKCGRYPNKIITNLKVAQALGRHSDFTGRVTGGSTTGDPGLVGLEQIAKVLWYGSPTDGEIIVSQGVENTGKEAASDTMVDLFGDHILIAFQDDGANPLFDNARPTAYTSFVWSEYNGMTSDGAVIKSWRSDDPDGTWRRVEDDYDARITANDCGVFLYGAVA